METELPKYRIKVKHYNKGGDEYYPQVRGRFIWKYLSYSGKPQWISGVTYESTEQRARGVIALHIQGQWKIRRIKIKTSLLYVY